MPEPQAAAVAQPLPWKRGLAWLAFLGPFFFLSYGFANGMAAQRGVTDALFFEWERQIPFVPWTIVPYWSIDLLYGLSFLLCRDRLEVDRHGLRLLTAQLVSVACFLLFPLRFAFERPPTEGLFGTLFDILGGFDQPFNQAPSLHISLLVILWARYAAATRGLGRVVVDLWALLIGVSVLTTWQHHFIDLPTGALVGLLCVWLWPMRGPAPLAGARFDDSPVRRRLAGYYLAAAVLAVVIALGLGGIWLWLSWAGVALGLVAVNYAVVGAAGFQKGGDGRLGLAVRLLAAPYLAGAWINSRWWTRALPRAVHVADGVWLGRMPTARDMASGAGGMPFAALVDVTAELPAPGGLWHYQGRPWLDLVPPAGDDLAAVARDIEHARRHGPVLVCCALGFSRSASAVAAWLLASGRAAGVDEAVALVRNARPQVVLGPAHRQALAGAFPAADAPLRQPAAAAPVEAQP